MRSRVLTILACVIVFLLPWQTRWMFGSVPLAGESFEYGTLSVYAIQMLIVLALLVALPAFHWSQRYAHVVRNTLLLLAVAAASILWSLEKSVSLTLVMHLLFAATLFFLLLDERVNLRHVIIAFACGLIAPSLLGFFQVLAGYSGASTILGLAARSAERLGDAVFLADGARVLRAYGSFPHPNIFGGYLAVALALLVPSAFEKKNRALTIALMIILTVALIATMSRSAILGLIFATTISAFVLFKKKQEQITTTIFAATSILILFGALLLGPVLLSRSQSANLESRSITERIEQYQDYPALIKLRPLLGSGIGTYTFALAQAYPEREWWEYQPIHNVPLLVFAELGVLGVLAAVFWAQAIDRINFARFPNRAAVSAFAAGNVVLVILFFDHYLWSLWSGLALLCIVMALTVRLGEKG